MPTGNDNRPARRLVVRAGTPTPGREARPPAPVTDSTPLSVVYSFALLNPEATALRVVGFDDALPLPAWVRDELDEATRS